MTEFDVNWSIPFDAEGPIDAAQQALGTMQDPESLATVFIVTDEQGRRFKVDLDPSLDEDEYEATPLPTQAPAWALGFWDIVSDAVYEAYYRGYEEGVAHAKPNADKMRFLTPERVNQLLDMLRSR